MLCSLPSAHSPTREEEKMEEGERERERGKMRGGRKKWTKWMNNDHAHSNISEWKFNNALSRVHVHTPTLIFYNRPYTL